VALGEGNRQEEITAGSTAELKLNKESEDLRLTRRRGEGKRNIKKKKVREKGNLRNPGTFIDDRKRETRITAKNGEELLLKRKGHGRTVMGIRKFR